MSPRWTIASGASERLAYAPVLHHTVESALAVGRAVDEVAPSHLAVELAPILSGAFREAVARLPAWSVVLFEDSAGGNHVQVVHPAEAFAEAVRVALERGIPWSAADADLALLEPPGERWPDAAVLPHLGAAELYRLWCEHAPERAPDPVNHAREIEMAHRLVALLDRGERVLFVTGLAHVSGVESLISDPPPSPLLGDRIRRPVLFNVHPESLPEITEQPPLVDALFELGRSMPPPLPAKKPTPDAGGARAARMPFTVIEGERRSEPELLRAAFVALAEAARDDEDAPGAVERRRMLVALFTEAEGLYRRSTDIEVCPWQRRTLDRFLAKYTKHEGRLLPDLYQVLAAARGAVDDNYAYEVFRLATYYPWQAEWSDLPTTRVSADRLFLGTRAIRIRRHLPRTIRRLQRFPVRRRPSTENPADWEEAFEDAHIVSYPPEDALIERFAGELKRRGPAILEAELVRSEPFSVSFRDGVDIRETLRHVDDGRLYVREALEHGGEADTVVVIFDTDPDERRFPFRMTWLGEHQNESDMAFYSTHPLDNVVGPGVSRCEYGGLMMIFPPMQLYDVWRIPEYARLTSRPDELLTVAALDYSRRRDVLHVAARPPRAQLRAIAMRLGRRLIHVPLGRFDPERLKKLRTFHILNGRQRREEVKKYLW